jgi:dephospho-CoA kinase
MIKVGITGGIGSGKSVVCRIFSLLGAPVYNADESAKRLMETDENVKRKLTEAFGNIYNKDGLPDRKKIGDIVFKDPEKLQLINSIIHPFVLEDYAGWEKKQEAAYVIKESAILFESGTDKALDHIVTVSAPEEKRRHRIIRRDNRSEEQVNEIIRRQLPEEEKIKRSDFTIVNDDATALLPQVWKLHDLFKHGK